jgi:O-antigen/teichoic acid export membrane protein
MSLKDNLLGILNNGNVRSVKAKKNIIASFGIKGISIIIGFIFVPLLIDYLGTFEYGIWITLGSIVGWINYFDIGLGNGLRNKFTEALANIR